jgi:hypothetical protein
MVVLLFDNSESASISVNSRWILFVCLFACLFENSKLASIWSSQCNRKKLVRMWMALYSVESSILVWLGPAGELLVG